jgi:signal transduction histidine kinase
MDEHRGLGGPPWRGGMGRPGWGGPPFGPGRRFRRGAFVVLLAVALLVAALATILASIFTGHAPAPGITVAVSIAVLTGLAFSARWLWRNARTIGALMDAADRVADGDLATRVPDTDARLLGRLTTAFNEMTEQLQTNEQRRRELLADIAHELRTPMQVIRGSVEGMLDGLYPVDADRLRPLLDETIVMARLLDDLRTLSMADAGVLELHRESIDPRSIADDVIHTFGSMADRGDVTLESVHGTEFPVTIEADPVRVAEVLTNLVTNALRHTPPGGHVTVRVAGGSHGNVSFVVDDTGPGIAPNLLPFVFDRFTTSADTDGTGLGLAIAKRLVEAHGGAIEASRNTNGGTRIRFTIPALEHR